MLSEYPTFGRLVIQLPSSPRPRFASPTVTSTVCRETSVPSHASAIIRSWSTTSPWCRSRTVSTRKACGRILTATPSRSRRPLEVSSVNGPSTMSAMLDDKSAQ